MNEEIILSMARPYVKDGSITYVEFEALYNMLSIREQYSVTNILYKNGIEIVDDSNIYGDELFDIDNIEYDDAEKDFYSNEFEIAYDESLFKDEGVSEAEVANLRVNYNVKQSNEILCSLIQSGNRQACQDLCVKNKRLVDKYVVTYQKKYGHKLDFEDLEQVGYIGLIKAARKFNVDQGTSFTTYAVHWIKQMISREIMDNGYTIRIPVHMMERINKVIAMDQKYINDGIETFDRIAKIANDLSLNIDAIRECIIFKSNYLSSTSLNLPVGVEEETELGELIPELDVPSVEEIVTEKALRESIKKVLNDLSDKEKKILTLRFGLEDGVSRTLEDVGRNYGVTRERIRQIEAKALRKLKQPTRAKLLIDYYYGG